MDPHPYIGTVILADMKDDHVSYGIVQVDSGPNLQGMTLILHPHRTEFRSDISDCKVGSKITFLVCRSMDGMPLASNWRILRG